MFCRTWCKHTASLGARNPSKARTSRDVPEPRRWSGELEKNYPLNTMLKLYWLPTINAAVALNTGNSSQAIVDLEAAAPYELGGTIINDLYPAYVHGQAYLQARNGTAAATEFQKILDHSGIVWNCRTGALAHLGVARANALQSRTLQGLVC
jgi:eukaryotic-like serine/threonine-protein kinase